MDAEYRVSGGRTGERSVLSGSAAAILHCEFVAVNGFNGCSKWKKNWRGAPTATAH